MADHNHHMNVTSFLRFCGLDIKKLAPRATLRQDNAGDL
jgi:hypothetical protein